ncbi:unnamed protein product [Didymodactylos carnosus]|uniref:Fatty acid hydroxylase domain-containing protein n=1 Tax=Didymodactylos carnosus TaxID=1234261 RepID=A0A814BF95_9BILA|nr:unnamed protein product [Didymodactylos carnosus]CAF0928477.1 unnamed protein product [Didymodactylos carnosus]CAF3689998.1 unnamed protein product [Didymodactylos carnosus]CAF3706832.1 unnamed protein product [Didymodactylos carnosus]
MKWRTRACHEVQTDGELDDLKLHDSLSLMLDVHIGTWIAGLLSLLSLGAAISWPYVKLNGNFSSHLLEMKSTNDYIIVNFFVFCSYTFQYMMTAGILEYTNPKGFASKNLNDEERNRRKRQIRKELGLGIVAMIINTTYAVNWMYFVEPYLWYSDFFVKRSYSLMWFLLNVIVYGLVFDTWFYWTHRALHESSYLWDKIHVVHHAFKAPSAFCQDAVHPLEGLVQGAMGHYVAAIFFPFHPIALAFFGLFTSCYAIAAHDGRIGDLNHHYAHHSKGKGRLHNFNYGLYWPLWDWICNTRYNDRKDEPVTKSIKNQE